jgi:hypothetical protein
MFSEVCCAVGCLRKLDDASFIVCHVEYRHRLGFDQALCSEFKPGAAI